ncbi:probable carbohydrate esterase At4g34215 [Andrographis paniculata]|uniref:probable carbohydrate esterase At4g34215 n=1 Tax=Andrographis paniculata TaxID=175694 RepID=UPI0021E814E1|nr:probable carbohydrate esterase At4g34215 [Andrographis paniculata]
MAALLWLLLPLAFSIIAAAPPNSGIASTPKSIFLLAGQSNMAGRGGLLFGKWDGYIPPECAPNPQIRRLGASLKWEEAHEPLHIDIDVERVCGIGPGMPFANSVLRRDEEIGVIGLVPCAVGGSNISQWSRGNPLYNQLIARARAALHGGGGEIKAMLWYQGEADTVSLTDATRYMTMVEKFFANVRTDLKMPMLPIFQVALASGMNSTGLNLIRKAQLAVNLPNVVTVDARGLPLQTDGLHLHRDGDLRLGQMLADAYLHFIGLPIPGRMAVEFDTIAMAPASASASAPAAPITLLAATTDSTPPACNNQQRYIPQFLLELLLGRLMCNQY